MFFPPRWSHRIKWNKQIIIQLKIKKNGIFFNEILNLKRESFATGTANVVWKLSDFTRKNETKLIHILHTTRTKFYLEQHVGLKMSTPYHTQIESNYFISETVPNNQNMSFFNDAKSKHLPFVTACLLHIQPYGWSTCGVFGLLFVPLKHIYDWQYRHKSHTIKWQCKVA